MGILKADPAPQPTPDIQEYLEAEVTVRLTRRQLYWLRKKNAARIEAAMQGMNARNASPARRSMRYEEYKFHRSLSERLHGILDEDGELHREHDNELTALIARYEKQAAELREFAETLREKITPWE